MNDYIQDIRGCIHHLNDIFDNVRLVDPVKRRVLTFKENGEVVWEDYFCHKAWSKEGRCENCIGIHAMQFNQRVTKFEFLDDEVYYVVAKPIRVMIEKGQTSFLIIEIISKMSDEIFFEAYGKNAFAKKIALVEKKIYEDPLTGVYNRRFFDERMFLYYNLGQQVKELAFILIDLHNFKKINDSFGHAVGDDVLQQTAKVLKSCIKENNSVVRMGGDEFLLILKNSNVKDANRIIKMIKYKMKEIMISSCSNYRVAANFGVAYTGCIINTLEFIQNLIIEADKNMYLDKKEFNLELEMKKE